MGPTTDGPLITGAMLELAHMVQRSDMYSGVPVWCVISGNAKATSAGHTIVHHMMFSSGQLLTLGCLASCIEEDKKF